LSAKFENTPSNFIQSMIISPDPREGLLEVEEN